MADETIIPVGADSCELRFADDTWLQLERDTTNVARWSFRGFRPDSAEPVATGVLTAAGAEVFARLAKSGDSRTGDESEELKIKKAPARKRPSRAKKPAAKKAAGKK